MKTAGHSSGRSRCWRPRMLVAAATARGSASGTTASASSSSAGAYTRASPPPRWRWSSSLIPRLRAGPGRRPGRGARDRPRRRLLPVALAAERARSVPPINDITTDTENPPAFVALLPLRAAAAVPTTYPGARPRSQRRAYPDIVRSSCRCRRRSVRARARRRQGMGWRSRPPTRWPAASKRRRRPLVRLPRRRRGARRADADGQPDRRPLRVAGRQSDLGPTRRALRQPTATRMRAFLREACGRTRDA